MPTTTITDQRITDNVHVAPEDVEVTIQTEPVSVAQPTKVVTLKSIDSDINSLQSQIGLMEAELEARRGMIADKQTLRTQVESQVTTAVASLKVAPVQEANITP